MTALTITARQTDFRPTPWAAGAHAQSILASAQPRRWRVQRAAEAYRAQAEELLIDCGAGVRLLGHFNAPADTRANHQPHLVVTLHGWEGSSDSIYNLTLGPRLQQNGFATLRLNFRDHGESHHLNEELFHSCRIDEVVGAFKWIGQQYPQHRVSVVGYSLGGNFALRVANRAAREGIALDRVVAICPVLDPAETMMALDSGSAIYEKYFIRKWRRSLVRKHAAFPHLYSFDDLAAFTNLRQMTDYFVTRHTEFDDLHTYLDGYAITHGRLDNIEVPTIMLLADDDPVIPVQGLRNVRLPDAVELYRSPRGGHCGFLQGWRLRSWVDGFTLTQLQTG
ncbi:MAG: alpha/beta fold hydrolase [Gammaproteobacteria bacterium]|nr:alpha/beta fold hydrolase [Gammaproteobacteria bacterium]